MGLKSIFRGKKKSELNQCKQKKWKLKRKEISEIENTRPIEKSNKT